MLGLQERYRFLSILLRVLRRILIAEMTELFVPNFEAARNATTRITDRVSLFGWMNQSAKNCLKDPYVVEMLLGFDFNTLLRIVPLLGL